MEYMLTYGWAFIIVAIVASLLFFFLQTPQTISPNLCTFSQAVLCTDLLISTPTGSASSVSFAIQNQGTYPLALPSAVVNIQGINSSASQCTGPGTLLAPGNTVYCTVTLPSTVSLSLGQFTSGTIYLYTQNCGLAGNFVAIQSCTNAPNEIITATFSGHTELTPPPTSGGYVFVTNLDGSSISIIYSANQVVVNTISLGYNPYTDVTSPNGKYVYVAAPYSGGGVGSGAILVINTATQSVVETIPGNNPYLAYVTPNGAYAYFLNSAGNNVIIMNTATYATNTISIPALSDGIAPTPNGAYAYTPSYANVVTVISTATQSVANEIPVDLHPSAVVVTPNGGYAYVADYAGAVAVISTATQSVVNTITIGAYTIAEAVTPNGAYVYAAGGPPNNGNVYVISTATQSVVNTIYIGGNPQGIYFAPNGAYAYVTNGDGALSQINTATQSVSNTLGIFGATPSYLAISPNSTDVYVPDAYNNKILVINAATLTITNSIAVGSLPVDLIFN